MTDIISSASDAAPSIAGLNWLHLRGLPELDLSTSTAWHGGKVFKFLVSGFEFSHTNYSFDSRQADAPAAVTHHFDEDDKHTGWIELSYSEKGVSWRRVKLIGRIPGEGQHGYYSVDARGSGQDIASAFEQAVSHVFERRVIEGVEWYSTGAGHWRHHSELGTGEVYLSEDGNAYRYQFRSSKLKEFLVMVHSSPFAYDSAKTEEEALYLASTYERRVIAAMFELTQDIDVLIEGRRQGRAALLEQILKIGIAT